MASDPRGTSATADRNSKIPSDFPTAFTRRGNRRAGVTRWHDAKNARQSAPPIPSL